MEKLKNKLKNVKSITLISLVVTIIILVIISSVSIGVILGNNGLIDRAKTAKSEYQNSVDEENKRLEEIYSSLLVATDGTVTIDYETLANTIIKLQNPVGSVIAEMSNSAPEGYLICNGDTYNIEGKYNDLAEHIKKEFGSYNHFGGDGTTTFAVPNLQGEFLRGYSSNSEKSVISGTQTTAVGVHQDPTLHRAFRNNGSNILFPASKNDTNYPTNYDTKIGTTDTARGSITNWAR